LTDYDNDDNYGIDGDGDDDDEASVIKCFRVLLILASSSNSVEK